MTLSEETVDVLLTPRASCTAEELFGRGVPDELAKALASIGLLAVLVGLVGHGSVVLLVVLGPRTEGGR